MPTEIDTFDTHAPARPRPPLIRTRRRITRDGCVRDPEILEMLAAVAAEHSRPTRPASPPPRPLATLLARFGQVAGDDADA